MSEKLQAKVQNHAPNEQEGMDAIDGPVVAPPPFQLMADGMPGPSQSALTAGLKSTMAPPPFQLTAEGEDLEQESDMGEMEEVPSLENEGEEDTVQEPEEDAWEEGENSDDPDTDEREEPEIEEEAPAQLMAADISAPSADGGNSIGSELPKQLKAGVESLSGLNMDDVRVHHNSDQPAQLKAHAYAQGTDIHLAPGQEKHLPHEAWHVAQQKQGRVKATTQMKAHSGQVGVNDDAGLEKEADEMGAKAMQMKEVEGKAPLQRKPVSQPVAQKVDDFTEGINTDVFGLNSGKNFDLGMNNVQIGKDYSKYRINSTFTSNKKVRKTKKKIRKLKNKMKKSSHSRKYTDRINKYSLNLKNMKKGHVDQMNNLKLSDSVPNKFSPPNVHLEKLKLNSTKKRSPSKNKFSGKSKGLNLLNREIKSTEHYDKNVLEQHIDVFLEDLILFKDTPKNIQKNVVLISDLNKLIKTMEKFIESGDPESIQSTFTNQFSILSKDLGQDGEALAKVIEDLKSADKEQVKEVAKNGLKALYKYANKKGIENRKSKIVEAISKEVTKSIATNFLPGGTAIKIMKSYPAIKSGAKLLDETAKLHDEIGSKINDMTTDLKIKSVLIEFSQEMDKTPSSQSNLI